MADFVCTECGAAAGELFKTYGSGILKLTECVSKLSKSSNSHSRGGQGKVEPKFKGVILLQVECGQVVDKYVEYDGVVLSLDLLLLKKSAFRHCLFNARKPVRPLTTDANMSQRMSEVEKGIEGNT